MNFGERHVLNKLSGTRWEIESACSFARFSKYLLNPPPALPGT